MFWTRFPVRSLARTAAVILAVVAVPLPALAQTANNTPSQGPSSPGVGKHEHADRAGDSDINACSDAVPPGVARCFARVRSDANARSRRPALSRSASPAGPLGQPGNGGAYDPSYLQSAYNAPSATKGAGQTVAVVDAFDDPNGEADLQAYRSAFHLPACTTANGCFRKVDQRGGTAFPGPDPSGGWTLETSLDVDMVSAMCPDCHILLVEADSDQQFNLYAAVDTATALGANVVSNSWGSPEYPGDAIDGATHFDHPGVAVTAATGDGGYGTEFPASSPYVTAVGGTTLTQRSNNGTRDGLETAWSGGGSGCSTLLKPSWQVDAGCADRTEADVSAVADPTTGVWAYDTYQQSGWSIVGGTSVATPIIASMYALSGNPASSNQVAAYPYGAPPGALNDVTSGSDGSCAPAYFCTAGTGYDGPTGLGTPNGTTAFGRPPAPSPPRSLSATATGGTTTLSWSAPANGGTGVTYKIYRSTSPGQERANDTAPLATGVRGTTFRDSGVVSGATSYYVVTAVGVLGEESGSSNEASAAPSSCTTFTSSTTGSHQVCGAILTKYLALGGPSGFLGYPTTDETRTPDGVGRYNNFAKSASIYWTPSTGAWSIHGSIRAKYLALGGSSGFLGYPITDETGTPDGVGRFNHFSSNRDLRNSDGSIYWTPSTGAWSIHGAIRAKWASMGWERSCLGYPLSDEFGNSRTRQSNFQRGFITFAFATGKASSSC